MAQEDKNTGAYVSLANEIDACTVKHIFMQVIDGATNWPII